MRCLILFLAIPATGPQVFAQGQVSAPGGDAATLATVPEIDARAVAELARRDGLSEAAARRYAETGCDSGTTPAMTYCAEYLFLVDDLRMNDLYKQKVTNSDKDAVALLRKSQRAWVTYRDSACEYESSGVTGHLHGYYVLSCQSAVTKERVARLEQYVSCTQNGCP